MYDVAFSFAGEDRDIVEKIKAIVAKEFSVFYDNDNQAEIIGKDLYRYLRNLYTNEARYVVCFLSEHYYKKIWTNLELNAIKERLMITFFDSDFLIPIKLDDAPVTEDIPSYLGLYVHTDIQKTSDLIKEIIRIPFADNSIITHRENLVEFILTNVCKTIQMYNLRGSIFQNRLYIDNSHVKTTFTFSTDEFLSLPCILIYRGIECQNLCADMIISWERRDKVQFSLIHTYDYTLDDDKKYSLQQLIKAISINIIQLLEG